MMSEVTQSSGVLAYFEGSLPFEVFAENVFEATHGNIWLKTDQNKIHNMFVSKLIIVLENTGFQLIASKHKIVS